MPSQLPHFIWQLVSWLNLSSVLLDLWLIAGLGFLGSFGHCVGMCGPIAIALAGGGWGFHLWLNLGRLLSYSLVGGAIGGFGELILAGVGSGWRQLVSLGLGSLLIWSGWSRLSPGLTFLGHDFWQQTMLRLTRSRHWWNVILLGMVWGMVPCGFLYTAQIKAAETANAWQGAATMCCFGLGTLPTLVAVGIFGQRLGRDRQTQVLQWGGWLTIIIGILTILRTDAHNDLTGHGALVCLLLAAIARSVAKWWPALLKHRRSLGVGGFGLALAHSWHMLEMSLNWHLANLNFLIPQHQLGLWLGLISLGLLTPLALTSFDWWQKKLVQAWRQLHLLSLPALVLAIAHSSLIGSSYLGGFELSVWHWLRLSALVGCTLVVFLLRLSHPS
ncbi:MAG: sulfite exporter TauE/SafE family protein [Pseudanabaenaceae cyanobacterium bins.68]|nr:sulfite exporter TauE/SafE family protein [Pseudanabaenaceae cyanobacterium bins.68]